MKSKKKHLSSSEESDDSNDSARSSSSESESEESSASEHRHKKKKKHDSSNSESESDDQKRSKKRKHKKKKKKHGKKKRRSDSVAKPSNDEFILSGSEENSKKKRKHKHKHAKRARSSSASESEEEKTTQRRLHSVVKERRHSVEEVHPTHTYYQREFRRSPSADDAREREVQRFYRGSSKERRQYQDHYDRPPERFTPYNQDHFDNKNRYNQQLQQSQFDHSGGRERNFNQNRRNQRYEEFRRPEEGYQVKPREEMYHSKPDPRGYGNNRFGQYDQRNKRRDYEEAGDYKDRRGQIENDRFYPPPLLPPRDFPDKRQYQEKRDYPNKRDFQDRRDYSDKREKYRDEPYPMDRGREPRRDKPPPRSERPPMPQQRERSRSRSYEDRPRERGRRADHSRADHSRDDDSRHDDSRRPHDARNDEHKPKPRERKSRFADAEDNKEYNWGKTEVKKEGGKNPNEKDKPNFGLSGKLTADANTVNGVVIKYTEPDDAKQPKRRWRFYPFKGDKALPILYIHRQSAFLIGRDKKVVDISLEHPSISKQHAALQYRATPFTRADGSQGRRVRPYVIDLESANGTFVNNKKIEPRRYVELLERDVVKFGFSQREYVLLHENSKDDALDDDQQDPSLVTTDHIKHEKRLKQEVVEDGE